MKTVFLAPLLLLFLSATPVRSPKQVDNQTLSFYRQVFPQAQLLQAQKIEDPISESPINTELLFVYSRKKELVGYIREVSTTTGCNSQCKPVIFTLFYDSAKKFKKLLSLGGLTKKNHAPFTPKNYFELEMILIRNPESFKKVTHPYDLVDIVSGATKPEYQNDVVKKAAYTSLRTNLYNQHTLKILKSLKDDKPVTKLKKSEA